MTMFSKKINKKGYFKATKLNFLILGIIFTTSITNLKANDLYLLGNVGINKSVTNWSFLPNFPLKSQFGIGLYMSFGNSERPFSLILKNEAVYSSSAVKEQNEFYHIYFSSGNGYGHSSIQMGKSISYSRKRKHINNTSVLASFDYWNIVEYSSSYKLDIKSNANLYIEWNYVNSDFGIFNSFGAGLHLLHTKTYRLKKGGVWFILGQFSINFVSLPELGVKWKINQEEPQSTVSRHTPIQLNFGVAKRIFKSKKSL